tara:strand:+ start:111 stop:335 length:225 start_codon:yes stop_codon:yes gene_type:complete
MYRKTKKSKGSNLADWNPKTDNGGGKVAGTIIGPMSSVGTTVDHPSPDQGMDKGIVTPSGSPAMGKKSSVGPNG